MFRAKRRVLERTGYTDEVTRHVDYPYRLNMYGSAPQMQMALEEFEKWAADRIRVLGELENFQLRQHSFKEIISNIGPVLDKYMPLSVSTGGSKAQTIEKERRKDHVSHFILRLAFCRTADLRDRFVQLETLLFKIRYETEDSKEKEAFINSLDLEWERVSESEKMDILPQLQAASPSEKSTTSAYYKVDFERVIDLVNSRKVFLSRGKAYVPESLRQSMVSAEFSSRLSKSMEQAARLLPRLDEDDRLVPVLKHLADDLKSGGEITNDTNITDGENITADMIDTLEKEGHFPLCMSTMHRSLRANRHAKFESRRQYGRFLKSIGMSIEESIKFWRKAMSIKSDDEFDKQYLYYFRHMYGLEGSRIGYQGEGCNTICRSGRTDSREPHGCPFVSDPTDVLTEKLKRLGITDKQNLAQIEQYVQKQVYHRACTEVYELTHPDDEIYTTPIGAPSIYFGRSFMAKKAQMEKKDTSL